LSDKDFPWGDQPPICKPGAENGARFNDHQYCEDQDTVRVGMYGPNNYGLYDMLGNVSEWVFDRHDRQYYRYSPEENPMGPENGKYRVYRGGSWGLEEEALRISYRWENNPDVIYNFLGFRCVSLP
jgi:formylglycine-generating enzyme required for sulfatase activity